MILLTQDPRISIIGGIIIVLIFAVVFIYRTTKNNKNKQAAQDFVSGLADEFYKLILKEIKEFKIDNFDSIEEYTTELLNKIYNTIYDYTIKAAEEAAQTDALISLAIKMIDKDLIIKIVDQVIEKGNINGIIKDNWSKYFELKSEQILEVPDESIGHDIDGNEIIYTGTEYNEDFDEKNDLPVVDKEIVNENDLSNIIPPSDNEESSFNEDIIAEEDIIESSLDINNINIEDTDEIAISYSTDNNISDENKDESFFIDKNGRKRDKITGRYIK